MAVIERDVVLMSKDADGNQTIDMPITRLGNIEGTADIKPVPAAADYVPVMDSADNGQMKKTTVDALADSIANVSGLDAHTGNATIHITAEERDKWNGKQDKLRGQSGQVVGFDTNGSAAAVQGWSNPNLLDNWYFADPINQRGKTEYTGNIYTIDRWNEQAITSASLFVRDDCIEISCQNNDGIRQTFESDEFPPIGTVMTVSILTKEFGLLSSTFTLPSSVQTYQYPGMIWSFAAGLIDNEKIAVWPAIIYNQPYPQSLSIIAAKLELGDCQTLAHQDASGNWVLNDPPLNKALELAKCQRYQYVFGAQFNGAHGRTEADMQHVTVSISLPTTIRGNPTVIIPELIVVGNGKAVAIQNIAVSGIATSNGAFFGVPGDFSTIGGLKPVDLYFNSGLTIDANL